MKLSHVLGVKIVHW